MATHKQGHNGKDGGNDEVRYEMDNDTSYDEDDENDEELEEECMVDYGESSAEIAEGTRNSSNSEVDDQGTEQPETNSTEAMCPDHVCTNNIFLYSLYSDIFLMESVKPHKVHNTYINMNNFLI